MRFGSGQFQDKMPCLFHKVELVCNVVHGDQMTGRGFFCHHRVKVRPEKNRVKFTMSSPSLILGSKRKYRFKIGNSLMTILDFL
jgi:hypothetical protein